MTHPIQSTKTLIKALIIAIVIAIILFITLVLPAEYNIDPTGIGQRLGLTILAAAPPAENSALSGESSTITFREDETTIIVPANKGLEYKFHLEQYGNLIYEWSTDNTALYFDLHGEPEGDSTGYFESFATATNSEMKGSITVPFAGSHGWYWRNSSDDDVTISLKTQGNYEVLGLR
ncbi:MAG: hypothetical protein JKY98_08780 [Gammaproteobacteria bacterium]|nr:hypothetical protein [Gammaproteobacteria bacterium]